MPAVGASVRTRWSHVLSSPADVHTAYALESVLDEVVFIAGPILVTVLATTWHPTAGLLSAALLGLAGSLAYAVQRGTEPPAHSASDRATLGAAMPWRSMLAIALVALLLGATLGAAEVITVAFTDEQGVKRWSGFLLALWAAGSLVAGVATGAVHWRRGAGSRLRWSAAALALAMAPLPWVGSVPVLALVLFVGGFAIAPTLIATNSLTEQAVPSSRLSEGMAIVHTGIAGGVAPGAALAGVVIDGWGASTAFFIPVVCGALLAVAVHSTPR
jgi:predicted MFS family arabinose efflux permease